MTKLEVPEEFVKDAYEAAREAWKGKIRKEFPELFEVKLDLGKWYKNLKWDGSYMLYNGTNNDSYFTCCGVTTGGYWLDKGSWGIMDGYRLATQEEIETMLWKEAEERGIGKDTKIEECLYWTNDGMGIVNINAFSPMYFFDKDQLWNNNACVYCSGQWATPLNENKEIQDKINSLQKQLDELKLKVK